MPRFSVMLVCGGQHAAAKTAAAGAGRCAFPLFPDVPAAAARRCGSVGAGATDPHADCSQGRAGRTDAPDNPGIRLAHSARTRPSPAGYSHRLARRRPDPGPPASGGSGRARPRVSAGCGAGHDHSPARHHGDLRPATGTVPAPNRALVPASADIALVRFHPAAGLCAPIRRRR